MNQYDKYIGSVFDERYKIVKRIGEGGMAVVFEAFDMKESKIVAVKVLKEEIADDSQSVKRFINESKAVAMMSHPNIVKIFDVSVKDDLKYIVMEHIDGVTLKSYMLHKGALSVPEAVSYTEQILRALDHAHTKGVTHRDIKPQNILLLKDGKIKVTDFGIAKLPNAETATMTDKAIGTVYYISPEQASGKQIDSRSDIYSLGIVMYEMLTGKLPFNGDTPVSVALMQINSEYIAPRQINPSIPVGIEQIISVAMRKKPEDRFQSARQMLSWIIQIKNDPSHVFNLPAPPQQEKKEQQIINTPDDKKHPADKPAKIRKRKYTMFPIILGLTLSFLLVAGISGWMVLSRFLGEGAVEEQTVTVTAPSLVGEIMSEELKRGLSASGFKVIIEYDDEDRSAQANAVLSQSPAPGTEKSIVLGKQTVELKLTLCRGEHSIVLPDVTVTDHRQVEILLGQKGLKCEEEYEYNENRPLGYVVKTTPAAGEVLSEGDTVVLTISKGQKVRYVQVPHLVGLSEKEAKRLIDRSDLLVGKITYEYSSKEKGTVLSQNKAAFDNVIAFSVKIDLVVSRGPEPVATTKAEEPAETSAPKETTASKNDDKETSKP